MRRIRSGSIVDRRPAATAASAMSSGAAPGMAASTGSLMPVIAAVNALRTVSSGTASPAANASSAMSAGRRPGRSFAASHAASSAAPGGGTEVLPRPRPG